MKLLILSGLPASGKTTLAKSLSSLLGDKMKKSVSVVSTSTCLKHRLVGSDSMTRQQLIEAGEQLDKDTVYSWICEYVAACSATDLVILDRVRKSEQLVAVKRRFPDALHVHLITDVEEAQSRYQRRDEAMSWGAAARADIDDRTLRHLANMVVETTLIDKERTAAIVAAALGF